MLVRFWSRSQKVSFVPWVLWATETRLGIHSCHFPSELMAVSNGISLNGGFLLKTPTETRAYVCFCRFCFPEDQNRLPGLRYLFEGSGTKPLRGPPPTSNVTHLLWALVQCRPRVSWTNLVLVHVVGGVLSQEGKLFFQNGACSW